MTITIADGHRELFQCDICRIIELQANGNKNKAYLLYL